MLERLKHLKGVAGVMYRLRLLRYVWQQAIKDRCLQLASALAFQTLFSMIPILALVIMLFPDLGMRPFRAITEQLGFDKIDLTASPASQTTTRPSPDAADPSVDAPTPADAEPALGTSLSDSLEEQLQNVYKRLAGGGLPAFYLLLLIFTATSLMLTLEYAVNEIHGVRKQRSILLRILVYWSILTLIPLVIASANQLNAFLASGGAGWLPGLLGWIQEHILPWLGASTALFMVYYVMPNTGVSLQAAVASAAVTGVLFQFGKYLFGLYVTRTITYTPLYGSLGVIPLFFFWVWIMFLIVLFGAELCFTIQHLRTLSLEEQARARGRFFRVDEMAIALVGRICHHFLAHEPPVSQSELLELAIFNEDELNRLVDALEDAGIIHTIEGASPGYVPARQPERIRVAEVVACAERQLVGVSIPASLSPSPGVNQMLNSLATGRQHVTGATTFQDLLTDVEPADIDEPTTDIAAPPTDA